MTKEHEPGPKATQPDVLDADGARELLHIGRGALYDGVARGTIPHRRIGKLIRFSRVALLQWLEGRTA